MRCRLVVAAVIEKLAPADRHLVEHDTCELAGMDVERIERLCDRLTLRAVPFPGDYNGKLAISLSRE
jgi:hypothetical protein